MTSQTAYRQMAPHDPRAELAERWPDWTVEEASLGLAWLCFDPWGKTILVSRSRMAKDPDRVLGQALALLDLDKVSTFRRGFSPEDERQAAWLAMVRLDRTENLPEEGPEAEIVPG